MPSRYRRFGVTCTVLVLLLALVTTTQAIASVNTPGTSERPLSRSAQSAPSLQVLPASGASGTMFRIAGTGFQPGEVLTLTVTPPSGDDVTSQVTADGAGDLVVFWDSSGQPSGNYGLAAERSGGGTVTGSWNVTPRQLCTELDAFGDSTLNSAWSWTREDATHWSLSERPGSLRIWTQPGTLHGETNDQRNLLLREAPSGSFIVTARVDVHANEDYQHAGIAIYEGDDHYVGLSRGQASDFGGQGIFFAVEAGQTYSATMVSEASPVVSLKLVRQTDTYKAFYSEDDVLWHGIGQVEVPSFKPQYLGFSASNGDAPLATEIPADLQWLRVDAPCIPLGLPAIMKAYTPVGRLLFNELMPEAASGESEWVELINIGPEVLDVSGYEFTDGDGNTYTFPTGLPELPRDTLVLIHFDGQGAAANDTDVSDGLIVLHSPTGLTDILDDDADQVAVYSGATHGPETIAAYLAYGMPPMEQAMDAVMARLWSLRWFVPKVIGTGWIGESGTQNLDGYSVGLFPGSGVSFPRRWSLYAPTEATPGSANPVPSLPWHDPPDGAIVEAATVAMGWQDLTVAEAYGFQLDDDPAFGSPLVDETVYEPRWQAEGPLAAGAYYWRVRVIGSEGRKGPWLAAQSLVVRDTSTSLSSVVESVTLQVPWLRQKKDTELLCIDGCYRDGGDAWDRVHPSDTVYTHGRQNCCRASIAMINHYYGGNISQDYLAYVELENWGDPFRYTIADLAGTPEGDLGHDFPSGPGSTRLAAWSWGFEEQEVDKLEGGGSFEWVADRIDDGRPMVNCAGGHCTVIDGYKVEADGTRSYHVVDPWHDGPGRWRERTSFTLGSLTAPPAGRTVTPVNDDATIHVDSDGDGIMNFDEINRFYTNPAKRDSDDDGIEDQCEIAAYLFANDGTYTYWAAADFENPPDGLRMELDPDNDGDGYSDGCEDTDRDGFYEPAALETSNWNAAQGQPCSELVVEPTTLSFFWTAESMSFEVSNPGGSSFDLRFENVPPWVQLTAEDGTHLGPRRSSHVVARVNRDFVGQGSTRDTFDITTQPDFGRQEMQVTISKDTDPPVLLDVSPTAPDPLGAADCSGQTTLDVTARVRYQLAGPDYLEVVLEDEQGRRSGIRSDSMTWTGAGEDYTEFIHETTVGPLQPGSYTYWVKAVDDAGNVTESDPYDLEVRECTPPVIGDVQVRPDPLYVFPCTDSRLTVQTRVQDDTGVRRVRLDYGLPSESGTQLMSNSMANIGDDRYETTLAEVWFAGALTYTVTAEDSDGNIGQGGSGWVQIMVCPSSGTIESTQSEDTLYLAPCEPSQLIISAEHAAGTAEWAEAEVWLQEPDEQGWQRTLPMNKQFGSDVWQAVVGPLDEVGAWYWKVTARTQAGSETDSRIYRFDVLPCEGDPPRITGMAASDIPLVLEPCAPSTITVTVVAESDDTIQKVDIYYKYTTEAVFEVARMAEGDPGTFSTTIGPFETTGTIEYYAKVTDSQGLTAESPVRRFGVIGCFTDGPTIAGIQIENRTIYPAPCTPDSTHIQAAIQDNSGTGITEVLLRYAPGDSEQFQELEMTEAGGGVYQATISGLTQVDSYRYGIYATDGLGYQSAAEWGAFVVAACDAQAPAISSVQADEVCVFVAPCEPNRVTVRAVVTDVLGLETVEIRYRNLATASTAWLRAPMEAQNGFYEGSLGDLLVGRWVYVIRAVNSLGVAALSEPHGFIVRCCLSEGPQIALASLQGTFAHPPCHPDQLPVRAQIGDPAGIESAYLLYQVSGGPWTTPQAMRETAPGEYLGLVGPIWSVTTGRFVVVAQNTTGNWSISEVGTFSITDCHSPTLGAPTESADPIYMRPCDLSSITIDVEVTDDVGVAQGWLAYRRAGGAEDEWKFAALQQIPGSERWGATAGAFDAPGVYAYALYVINQVGGDAWSEAGTFTVQPCETIAIEGVDTSTETAYVSPCKPEKVTVSATISATNGVDGAWVAFRNALGEREWTTVVMQATGQPGAYAGLLGPFGAPMTLEYQVAARSVEGAWAWSDPQQITVSDCQGPSITKVSSSEEAIHVQPCEPNTTVVSAQVTDALGLDTVVLRYRNRKDESWSAVEMTPTDASGGYAATLGPLDAEGVVNYLVVATNTAGAVAVSDPQTLAVGPCK